MGIGHSNAKAADPGSARDSIGLPLGKLGIDKEGTIFEIDFRVYPHLPASGEPRAGLNYG